MKAIFAWWLLLFVQLTLIAQTTPTSSSIRPADLVAAHTADFQRAPRLQPLQLTADAARSLPTLDLPQYQLLALDAEAAGQLETGESPVVNMQLPLGGGSALQLQLVAIDMEMPTVSTSSGEATFLPLAARHYRGIIAGDPSSVVALSVVNGEVYGLLSAAALGGNWVLAALPNAEHSDLYVLYPDAHVLEQLPFHCDAPDSNEPYTAQDLRPAAGEGRGPGDCVSVYFEVDYDIFVNKGGVSQAVQYVTALFNQVATLYANDQVSLRISEIMVWNTQSPYNGTSSGQLLTQFQTVRTSFNGDLAQLLSYKASGGVAVVDGLCHPYTLAKMSYAGIGQTFQNVPTYSWTVMVVAHELGHLLGSQHTHACAWNGNGTAIDGCPGYTEGGCTNPGIPQGGGTIMSYCHLTSAGIDLSKGFGVQPGNLIRNRINAATCLSACPTTGGGGSGGGTGGGSGNGGNPTTTVSCQEQTLYLRLRLDTYSPETTWQLKNAQQQVVAQGGPYLKTQANQTILDTLCVPQGCYTFVIRDSYNDGICCTYGQGNYLLTDANQQTIAQGGQFPAMEETGFCMPFVPGGGDDDCTRINFAQTAVISFGTNQDAGQYAVQDNGQTLYIANNAWKAVAMDYQVGPTTVIAFDFKSSREGEIQGIGFDNNDVISANLTFRVYGFQEWGINNFDNYPGNNTWRSYVIPVGQFYQGAFNRLFFCADHDGGTRNGNAWFRNVRIFEQNDCGAGLVDAGSGHLEPEHLIGENASAALRAFPNPASDVLYLQINGGSEAASSQYKILNTLGQPLAQQTVQTQAGQQEIPVQINHLPPGSYLLRWQDAAGEQTITFHKH